MKFPCLQVRFFCRIEFVKSDLFISTCQQSIEEEEETKQQHIQSDDNKDILFWTFFTEKNGR